jgi:SRSO17 transposase
MEARFLERKLELLNESQVDMALFAEITGRLRPFVMPFVASLYQEKQRHRAVDFVGGLLSDLERKNAESIAYRYDQEREEMQYFLGGSQWDHRPMLLELARQVGQELGRPDGVLIFDPSGFPKKGTESVGVQRQWCGRLGKIDNCQVGVFMAYASSVEHTLVNMRLYLPQDWATDRARRAKCRVPRAVRFQTRHQLSLEMLDEMGHLLPHGWIAGDDEMGRSSAFRRELRARKERYLLAVPSNTLIRALDRVPDPSDAASPLRPARFQRVDQWCQGLPEAAWYPVNVRDGDKGPLTVELISWRVEAKSDGRRVGPEELLVVTRCRDESRKWKHDYYLSNAEPSTSPEELARVAKAEHRIEDCLQRAKGDTGLDHYEVRSWDGWHHHLTLSMLALWFLNVETRRGEKKDAGNHAVTVPTTDRQGVAGRSQVRPTRAHRIRGHAPTRTKPTRATIPLQTTQPLGTTRFPEANDLKQ